MPLCDARDVLADRLLDTRVSVSKTLQNTATSGTVGVARANSAFRSVRFSLY